MQPKLRSSETTGPTATRTAGRTPWPGVSHRLSPRPGFPPMPLQPETFVSSAHCPPCTKEGLEPPGGWRGHQEPRGFSVSVFPSQWRLWCPTQKAPDAWDKCSDLVHWEDPEGSGGEGGGGGWGFYVWQKPLQYYKVISLQLIKIKKKISLIHLEIKQRIHCIYSLWKFS